VSVPLPREHQRLGTRFILAFLALGLLSLCSAESATGVLFGETGGQGANPVRAVKLAVMEHVYYLEYAPRFFRPKFRTAGCWDIGSVWDVEVTALNDLGELTAATCAGDIDPASHAAATLVRQYLKNLERRDKAANVVLLSRKWRRSPESRRYSGFEDQLDMATHGSLGRGGRCVEIDASDSHAVHLNTADCSIKRAHNVVDLRFTVVPKATGNRYEIDAIELEER
jgi:hypothetical protein